MTDRVRQQPSQVKDQAEGPLLNFVWVMIRVLGPHLAGTRVPGF
jgi:hypothetical protein